MSDYVLSCVIKGRLGCLGGYFRVTGIEVRVEMRVRYLRLSEDESELISEWVEMRVEWSQCEWIWEWAEMRVKWSQSELIWEWDDLGLRWDGVAMISEWVEVRLRWFQSELRLEWALMVQSWPWNKCHMILWSSQTCHIYPSATSELMFFS